MKHLGDITQIKGYEIEPVDCITFGSPCQDLSIAGDRAGLAGERSGLFMEAVRIIREMRCNTFGSHPTFAVWENVPGAFSSNKGEDFRAVLEELAHIKCPWAVIPGPPKGKWRPAGRVLGDGWSIAWRTMDAQYWGVPQRRRRIALVMDLGGQRAGEILFEREGVPGDTGPRVPPWPWIARRPGDGACGDDRVVGWPVTARCLTARQDGSPDADRGPNVVAYTLKIRSGCEGGGKGPLVQDDKSATLGCHNDQYLFCRAGTNANAETCENLAPTLNCMHDDPIVFRKAGRPHSGEESPRYQKSEVANTLNTFDVGESRCNEIVYCPETAHALKAKANCDYREDSETYIAEKFWRWIVRRLTPTECARLQGYPDDWCRIPDTVVNGRKVKYSDSAAYRAYGNSIALPQWWWLTCRMAEHLPEHAALGSLFDGIGGFPLVWEMRHGTGTARWASEIEPFCIAVTRYRFGEPAPRAEEGEGQ